MQPTGAAPVFIPTSSAQGSSFSPSPPTRVLFCFLIILAGVRCCLIVSLICFSLMVSDESLLCAAGRSCIQWGQSSVSAR